MRRRMRAAPTPGAAGELRGACPGGFAPRFWGANGRVLHAIAWGYALPDEVVGDDLTRSRAPLARALLGPDLLLRREACRRFYRSLVHVLPCGSCCRNYALVIEGKPVRGKNDGRTMRPSRKCVLRPGVFDSRARLTAWLHSVHNCNRRTHGKARDVTLAEARRMYAGRVASAPIWGHPLWNSLLFVAWSFPTDPSADPTRAAAFVDFFSSLAAVLPSYASGRTRPPPRSPGRWPGRPARPRGAGADRDVPDVEPARARRRKYRGDFARFERTVCSRMASLRGE